ncbi:MAG: methyltransferase domain-containing protein [Nanoarchaeota archaeon]
MEDNKLENTYESKNFLVGLYFRWKVDKAIRIAKLKKDDIILDFGCGGGWLEKKLKDYKIFGYDTNPEKTFIKDYRKIKPTKIFVLDVFEHIPISETKKILENFKKMNNEFELVVSQPTENWISRKVRKLVGKAEVPAEHITRYEKIVHLLKENFIMEKKINFFTVTQIFVFRYKK